jgi:hypothetical protein
LTVGATTVLYCRHSIDLFNDQPSATLSAGEASIFPVMSFVKESTLMIPFLSEALPLK